MNTILRSARAIFRSPVRTLLLTLLLAVSMSLVLTMLVVGSAVDDQIAKIRSEVGTDIHLSPSGAAEPGTIPTMSEDLVDQILDLEDVSHISKRFNQMLEDSPFVGAALTEAGKALMQNRGMSEEDMANLTENATITIAGSNTPDALSSRGRVTSGMGTVVDAAPNVEIIEGRTFSVDELNENVAVIGAGFAQSNDLDLGDIIEIQDIGMEIIGIFATDDGDVLGQNTIFMPLKTVQRIFNQEGVLTSAVIFATDAGLVPTIVEEMGGIIENPNVTTNEGAFTEMAQSLENTKNSTQIGMVASLGACVVIILFAVSLTIRSRVKEIGILKAVGASNGKVLAQFGMETTMIGLMAAMIAGIATFIVSDNVATLMLGDSMDLNVSVSTTIFALALGMALLLALIGSLIPAWSIARIKPAEVLRYE